MTGGGKSAESGPIHRTVVPGFEADRDTFRENFDHLDEPGAAVAVVHRGVPVVDPWSGHRDTGYANPWEKETMVLVASGTKGMAAAAIAVALSRGSSGSTTASPVPPSADRRDVVIGMETAYAMGYSKPSPGFRFRTSPIAFGTPGAGGCFGVADPDLDLGFAYTPNRWGLHLEDDPGGVALRDAVYDCLDRQAAETAPVRS